MPASTDVLVVGGGLAGCCAAWMLARAGVEVVLVEARGLNTLASGSNAGSLHAQIRCFQRIVFNCGLERI